MRQQKQARWKISGAVAATLVLSSATFVMADTGNASTASQNSQNAVLVHAPSTTTPIQHVVVIFGENISFDHYFATYPNAANPSGEPAFYAAPGTPSVNGLTQALLTNNPNGANPQRLDRSQPITDDMDHGYTAEQQAMDSGLMDNFVKGTGRGSWPTANQSPAVVMNYYDGNTVTALWNYAQHFAMSDNSFGTTFGPSTPGALNLISGQTHGAVGYASQATGAAPLTPDTNGVIISGALNSNNTLYSDVDPHYDTSSNAKKPTVAMTGQNVGDLLNGKGITWGWFEGGFSNPTASSKNVAGMSQTDYIPHHEPFQYYQSTSNPNHLPPSSTAKIGYTDQANHQYDLSSFWAAADANNMPAVSFLKAPGYQDGHAGYSDPLDEQQFLVDTINRIEQLPTWKNTAIVLSWDDSDGWYDHVMSPILNGSNDPLTDVLAGKGNAGNVQQGAYLDRAGYGPRLPLLVISPYAKRNFVTNSVSDQSSILRFIEDNWSLGRIGDQSYDAKAGSLNNMFDFQTGPNATKLILDPTTGQPVAQLKPFTAHGVTYMSIYDIAQAADFGLNASKHAVEFTYAGKQVSVPMHGDTITVDGQSVKLAAPLTARNNQLCLPVTSLAAALGATTTQTAQGLLWLPAQS